MHPPSLLTSHRHPAVWRYPLLLVLAVAALLGASLLTMVNVPRALACPVCVAPDKVTVAGSGISGTATITGASLISDLGAGSFMGFEHPAPVAEPIHTGNGYELVRYFQNSGVPASFGTQGFDHMRYYPGASSQPGYIYYEGFMSEEARSYAQGLDMPLSGHWFRLTAVQDAALQQLLGAAHANPAKDAASAPPMSFVPPTSAQPPAIIRALTSLPLPVIILVTCMVLLIAGAGFRVLYLRRHRAPFTPAEDLGD